MHTPNDVVQEAYSDGATFTHKIIHDCGEAINNTGVLKHEFSDGVRLTEAVSQQPDYLVDHLQILGLEHRICKV